MSRPFVDVVHQAMTGGMAARAKIQPYPTLTPAGRYYLEAEDLEARQIAAATKAWYATKADCTQKSPTHDPDPYILAIVKAVRGVA